MWPVAPKTSHTLGVGGLDSEGGSVLGGSARRVAERWEEGDVGDSGDVAAITAFWAEQCYMSGLVRLGQCRAAASGGCHLGVLLTYY